MPPRFYLAQPLRPHDTVDLPAGPARHAQVLRLQPGDALTLFNGEGGEWRAEVGRMGRSDVQVRVISHQPVERELPVHVTLALGMPANERMDTLVEKATELGVAALQPLICERSVLRMKGERADKKVGHWQGVAHAASEQSGRTRVPVVHPVMSLPEWLRGLPPQPEAGRWVLSLQDDAQSWPAATRADLPHALFLSGPEGGLTGAEEALARSMAFRPVSLGPRVLRADTAPLAALAVLSLQPPAGTA